MKQRQVSILSGAGVLCLLLGGDLSAGYQIISFPGILLRAGVIFLTLGVITYLVSPITVRDAVLGGLCASVLVFISGTAVMYYSFVLGKGPPPTVSLLLWTQAQGLLVTLPISTGYLSGVLVRTNRRVPAIAVLLGAMLGGWRVGSWVALSLGSAPGFTQMFFLLGVLDTGGLAALPIAVIAEREGIPGNTRDSRPASNR